tara:strand:+ start:713 stop:1486 length:774 start_codon:yes stop_codon:yes gene_type:complete
MNTLVATIRDTNTKGQVKQVRSKGEVPCVIYGGKEENQKIKIPRKEIQNLIEKENFLSNVITLNIDGKTENVLPREISFDVMSDKPIHVDFVRIVKGATIILEIPVKFINRESSPGLKRGGVLNIVRRSVELKCPTENIPTEIVVDLDGLDIGSSIKISSVKLPENISPTIKDRDFVIATVAAPTVIKEPEKPAEDEAATTEGAEGEGTATEATTEDSSGKTPGTDGDKKAAGGDKKAASGDKKAASGDKKAPTEKK